MSSVVETFTPEILVSDRIATYATMLVQLSRCPLCGALMVYQPDQGHDLDGRLFPAYCRTSQDAQRKRAGWHWQSSARVDDDPICQDCADAGRATILCELCGERKPSDRKQEQFGDPPVYLCRDCYDTVPAAQWDAKRKELREAHQWDFE